MKKISVTGRKTIVISGDTSITICDGENAQLFIKPKITNSKIVLKIGKGCKVSSLLIQDCSASISMSAHVGEGSFFDSGFVWMNNGKADFAAHLDGKSAKANAIHVFVQSYSQEFSLDTSLFQENKDTQGNILVKGIIRDQAIANVSGLIRIKKHGEGAVSFLGEHALLLNPGARATATPELEIENNDVSSKHAASVTQVDEEKLFYLMTRGITRDDAKKLIVRGFLESAIEKIQDSMMRGEMERCLKNLL